MFLAGHAPRAIRLAVAVARMEPAQSGEIEIPDFGASRLHPGYTAALARVQSAQEQVNHAGYTKIP